MKKYLSLGNSFLMAWAFVGTTTLNAQVSIKGGWTDFGIQNSDTIISMDCKELATSNRTRLFYVDYRESFDISMSIRFNTLITEQAFLCKEGVNGEMFADLTIGFDPETEQVFAEIKDEKGKLHRIVAGDRVKKGVWNEVKVGAIHHKKRHESTLTLTVKNELTGKTESASVTYPGYALRYNVSRWIVGRGFPGGFPNSLQVRRGDIKGIAFSGVGKERVVGQNPIFTEPSIVTDDMTPDSHRSNADIDPTVFIDDDGQAYIAWGNGDCYMG